MIGQQFYVKFKYRKKIKIVLLTIHLKKISSWSEFLSDSKQIHSLYAVRNIVRKFQNSSGVAISSTSVVFKCTHILRGNKYGVRFSCLNDENAA